MTVLPCWLVVVIYMVESKVELETGLVNNKA